MLCYVGNRGDLGALDYWYWCFNLLYIVNTYEDNHDYDYEYLFDIMFVLNISIGITGTILLKIKWPLSITRMAFFQLAYRNILATSVPTLSLPSRHASSSIQSPMSILNAETTIYPSCFIMCWCSWLKKEICQSTPYKAPFQAWIRQPFNSQT